MFYLTQKSIKLRFRSRIMETFFNFAKKKLTTFLAFDPNGEHGKKSGDQPWLSFSKRRPSRGFLLK